MRKILARVWLGSSTFSPLLFLWTCVRLVLPITHKPVCMYKRVCIDTVSGISENSSLRYLGCSWKSAPSVCMFLDWAGTRRDICIAIDVSQPRKSIHMSCTPRVEEKKRDWTMKKWGGEKKQGKAHVARVAFFFFSFYFPRSRRARLLDLNRDNTFVREAEPPSHSVNVPLGPRIFRKRIYFCPCLSHFFFAAHCFFSSVMKIRRNSKNLWLNYFYCFIFSDNISISKNKAAFKIQFLWGRLIVARWLRHFFYAQFFRCLSRFSLSLSRCLWLYETRY